MLADRRRADQSCMFVMLILAGITVIAASCSNTEKTEEIKRNSEIIHSEVQSFIVDTIAADLERPWGMAFLPDESVLITERDANLLVIRDRQSPKSLKGNIPNGLRDIELHPQYEDNGWIYISYYREPAEDESGASVLMRARLDSDVLVDDEVLYSAGPFTWGGGWTGSRIVFDRDNYVYYPVGIRGDIYTPQDKSLHSGKIMRLHDDGSIPSDNPFVDKTDALPEIYTYGHREHQGLAIHPISGDVWSNEHGALGGDELNIIKPGLNYGWPLATYSLSYDGTPVTEETDTLRDGMEPPVHHWTPAIAPSGLAFVVGDTYPGWNGNVFSGSLAQRMLNRSVIKDDRVVHDEKLLVNIGRVRTVKVGPDGFLYLLTEDTGLLVRLLPAE
jgi:aldose sugar dehydrogenase